jgi:hypothetical protein
VNINGNTCDTLVDDRLATVNALQIAIECLGAQYPHGRNYQTAPAGAYEAARKLHEEQMNTLRALSAQVYVEALFIQEKKR